MMLSIRTQDRMALVPYNSAILIREYDKNWIAREFSKDKKDIKKEIEYTLILFKHKGDYVLGKYKTKERTLEVLDEIQEMILSQTKHFIDENELVFKTVHSVVVYQMPKE